METSPRRFPRFVGIALGVIFALMLVPTTRWMVKMQTAMQVSPFVMQSTNLGGMGLKDLPVDVSPGRVIRANHAFEAAAANHPGDYEVQLVAARIKGLNSWQEGIDEKAKERSPVAFNLRELRPQFGDHPGLYAHILRYASQGEVRMQREEENMGKETPKPAGLKITPVSPEALAEYDEDAAEGERLDPDNAYFPFMRSVSLFAEHRDSEAIAAIQRAAAKPAWREYIAEEMVGDERILVEDFGDRSAITRSARAAMILFPHYARLRAVARIMVYKAMQAEKAGRPDEGMQLRQAILHAGSKLRGGSSSAIGTLVGIAIQSISTAYPGGEIKQSGDKSEEKLSAEERSRKRLDTFYVYLRNIGHPEAVTEFRGEMEAGQRGRQIIQKGIVMSPFMGPAYKSLSHWWATDLLLSGTIIWLLFMAGLAALVAYFGRRSVPVALVAAAIGFALLAFLSQRCTENMAGSLGMEQMMVSMTEGGDDGSGPFWNSPQKLLAAFGMPALALSVFLVVGIVCLRRRQPLVHGMMRGLTSAACLLVLVYAGCVLFTLRPEAEVHYGLDRTLTHEGRYLAELVGEPWPE